MTSESDLKKVVWENLSPFRMDQETIDEVINEARGCAVCYVKKDGQPVSVWVSHAVMDGKIYVTTTENRGKTARWRADPRTSLTFAVPGKGAVTVLGTVTLDPDPVLRRRFLETLADRGGQTGERRELWMKHMNSEGRVTGLITPKQYITFDERKLVM
ncbi:MAG: pyridoxamine 5'-phosphate oxidase family protein [Dehalococcoidia bacterium]|nr:pyridoxamine 5'-phosphate oxidase family protein [Dehalococcoidia bacterium]